MLSKEVHHSGVSKSCIYTSVQGATESKLMKQDRYLADTLSKPVKIVGSVYKKNINWFELHKAELDLYSRIYE